MVKPSKPESQPEPQQENFDTSHPLMRKASQAEDLLARATGRKAITEFQITEKQQWADCVNQLAATPNGKMLFKSMIDYSGVLAPPDIANANRMVTNTLKGAFYYTWVRPYLKPEVRKELD